MEYLAYPCGVVSFVFKELPHIDTLVVGDGHQRIYAKNKATMSRCGIDIRGRASKLYLNYRTTEEIRREAVSLLEGVEVDDSHRWLGA